jgi:predicted RND superfamily exporter protein
MFNFHNDRYEPIISRMKIIKQLHLYRFFLLVLSIIICVLLGNSVKSALTVDNSLSVWFLKDDPMLVQYERFRETFGNDEVIICVVHDATGLLSDSHREKFRNVTVALNALPDVASVFGPGSIKILKRSGIRFDEKELMDGTINQGQICSTLDSLSLLKAQLFSSDYHTARFIIYPKVTPDFDINREAILRSIKQVVLEHLDTKQTYFGGVGVIYAGLNRLSQQDFGKFIMIGYGIMFALIILIYRRPMILVYVFGTVALSTFITLGVYGLLGYTLNLMTTLLPIIFVLIGIMDITHILNEQSLLSSTSMEKKEKAFLALAQVSKPALFNSLTMIIGFLSLLTSPMLILRTFGLFAAIGIMLCFVFTYLLGVIILPGQTVNTKLSIAIGPQLVSVVRQVLHYWKWYAALCAGVVILSVVGMYFLKKDTYTLGYFPKNDQVVIDHVQMEKVWGAYMPLDFMVEVQDTFHLSDKKIVQQAIEFTDLVQKSKDVESAFGFHSVYLIGLQQYHPIHYERLVKSQYSLTQAHKNITERYPEVSRTFVDSTGKIGRITFFGKMVSAAKLQTSIDTMQRYAAQTLGTLASVTPAGYQPMYTAITHYATSSQFNSLFTASIFIFLFLWMFLQDLKLSLIAVISNYFPIITMFGLMGLAGINLDTATSSIAVIVLSICIDDTVHFMYQYRELRKNGVAPADAREQTVRRIGPAVVLTALLLFAGYAFMMMGSLQTVRLFGILIAFTIALGLFAEFVVLPLLLARFAR